MNLLVDVFGYLVIVLHGGVIAAQSIAVGSVVFLAALVRPLGWMFGADERRLRRGTLWIGLVAALALALVEAARLGLDGAVLTGTLDIPWAGVAGAEFAVAGIAKIAAALLLVVVLGLAMLLGPRGFLAGGVTLLALLASAAIIAAGTATTHAAARLTDRGVLLAVSALHQLGAALWIGGIPAFVAALARFDTPTATLAIGRRFSLICQIGVGIILVSAAWMYVLYIGDVSGLYGTAYGVMVGTKMVLFAMLLLLGRANFRTIAALGEDRTTPRLRLRRFAEAEIGIGITLFFAAAALTSVPPAVDLPDDRVTLSEIVERNWPVMPRLTSPEYDALTIPALQAKLDAEAAANATKPAPAIVPGSGAIASINAEDIAWSEYNHHWSGIFVAVIGLLALAHRAGFGPARHWPLVFLGLAGFLFLRSDPEVWPLGQVGFFESLREPEVLQHRFFVLLTVIFGVFEWRVRAGGGRSARALIFPLVTAIGGAALLTHSHAIANVKDQLLIELTHTPLALAGIVAGWARWLELRLDPPDSRIAGLVWPICFVLVGVILLMYREA